jgi:hypothetical protein
MSVQAFCGLCRKQRAEVSVRLSIRRMLGLSTLLIATCTLLFSQTLATVESVHVGEMGTSDEAARFRLLLEEELAERGFQVVEDKAKADAVMTGVLTVRVYDDELVARAKVALKDRTGKRIWGGDFGPRRCLKCAVFLKRIPEPVAYRAENIADDLAKAREKAKR